MRSFWWEGWQQSSFGRSEEWGENDCWGKSRTYYRGRGEKEEGIYCNVKDTYISHFHSQDPPYCLPFNSYDVSSENLVLNQVIIP